MSESALVKDCVVVGDSTQSRGTWEEEREMAKCERREDAESGVTPAYESMLLWHFRSPAVPDDQNLDAHLILSRS